MGRIGRSFELVGQSYRILMQDKELMVLPLMGGTITAAVALSFFVGFRLTVTRIDRHDPSTYIPLFLFYIVSYAVGIFFQAAVIAGATERMSGGEPTIASSIGAASRRIGAILVWALFAATVGTVLRAVQERVGFLGKIIVAIIGSAWSVATFFVVPVLVLEDRSVRDSVTRSVDVLKKTWGETVVGSANVGVIAFLGWVTLVAIVGLIAWAGALVVALGVGVVGAILIIAFSSALHGVYVASLYRFATHGDMTEGFDTGLLREAFVEKH